jgi:hypothetical protein
LYNKALIGRELSELSAEFLFCGKIKQTELVNFDVSHKVGFICPKI